MTQRFLAILMLAAMASSGIKAQDFQDFQDFPDFLEGTWKVADGTNYEHWDRAGPTTLKGVMFSVESGLPVVTEYLEIKRLGDKVIYTATVLDQNRGEGIPFTMVRKDSAYSFENQEHDFPRIIRYKPVTSDRISVYVGTEERGFKLELLKVESGQ